jgi:hypothetical protein
VNTPLPAGSRGRRSWPSAAWQFACLAFLGSILGLTAFRLFSGMTVVGMNGVDTFEYWKYADEFLHGKSDFEFDRLAFYAINVAAFKLLGANDYAMRAFVGAFALINIALVYLLGWMVARNAVVALAAAVLYAFNPTVLMYATMELPHVAGATFVLIAALFALPASDQSASPRRRRTASFLLGAMLAAAVLTHEDLVFLTVGYVLAIALPAVLSAEPLAPSRPGGRDLALTLASLVLGGAACAAVLMFALRVGPIKMAEDFFHLRTHFNKNTAVRTGGDFFGYVTLRMLKNFTVDTVGGVVTAVAVVLGVIVPAKFVLRRCDRMRVLLTLELPVLMFVVCFLGVAQIYLEGPYRRIFVPLIGPTLVFAVCGSYLLLQPLRRGIAIVTVLAGVAYVLFGFEPWTFASPPISPHRRLYDAVKDLVTPERKLLLPACYADYRDWVGIGSRVYLDGDAVPIYHLRNWMSFDALIAAEQVGYVYVPGLQLPGQSSRDWIEQLFRLTYGIPIDSTLLNGLPQVSQEIWRGDTRVVWTDEACKFEAQVLRRLLSERGARLVETVPGEIYELPRPAAPPSSARP